MSESSLRRKLQAEETSYQAIKDEVRCHVAIDKLLNEDARVADLADTSNLGRVVKMVIGESGNFPEIARIWHDDVVAVGLGLLTKVIARAQAQGEVRAGDPRQYALSIAAPLLTAVIFRETFVPTGAKPFDIPALMQQHIETFLPGLLTTGAKP